ncbi:heavy metal-associated isoprenylated plant protein 36-like [Cornus florida]|uniref:heavy metal-associated isoprenylated plant protein 36-like n=1 Tax=Cornus florida TaxID=4283 RepID=UPI00289BF267|nr:heavy metal-associated isoprenylated plant protein 36-like [Cornus florida]
MPCIYSPFTLHPFLIQITSACSFPSLSSSMIPQLEKPRVTEIQVRMDCNGCIQKIKKALHGIKGIYDLYIDFPQQKLTIIGWADPEKIIKALKKARKMATICSHTEPTEQPAQPTEPAPENGAPAPEAANQPPAEPAPPAETAPPTEAAPPKDPLPPENLPPEVMPSSVANANPASQAAQSSRPKDVEEVHVIYHHPPDYGYRFGPPQSYHHGYGRQLNNYPNGPGIRYEPTPPAYVTHSYNSYKPSPYVTEYEYIRSPPRYTHYSRPEHYSEVYHSSNNGNGNITSMFSDENPNACRIV